MNYLIDKECPAFIVKLATLNFILGLYGYEFIATIGSPFMSLEHSQFITIPYRAICLGISLFLIIRCKANQFHFKPIIICLILYWSILILRLVYDFYLQWDFDIKPDGKNRVLIYFLCINLPQTLSYALSWDKIDYKRAFRYLAIMLVGIALFNLVLNPALLFGANMTASNVITTDGRITGGIALNTISFAHCGVALSLCSIYICYFVKNINKVVALVFFCLGAFIVLKAGSRGPFLCLILMVLLFYSFKTGRVFYIFFVAIILCTLLYLFKDLILDFIKDVAPVLYRRILLTIEKGNLSGRDRSFADVLQIWKANPLTGKYFTYYLGTPAMPGYTHNVFFDSAIMGGVVGVFIMAYFYYAVLKSLFISMKYSSMITWIPLIIVQKFLGCLSSGAFWETPALSMGVLSVTFLSPYFYGDIEDENVL